MVDGRGRFAPMGRLVYLAVTAACCVAQDVIPPVPFEDRVLSRQEKDFRVGQRLAVVVPAYAGDLHRAVGALSKWPRECSPSTQDNADVVLYYAGGPSDDVSSLLPSLRDTAGHCFANTKIIYANLNDDEDVYPKGPSVQFYKLLLDDDIRADMKEYDYFAILEWDVLVAHESSFDELYKATFDVTDSFWVKGSVFAGTNFHRTAESSDMWHVLGHINGNAIYNNNDPAFVEYVDYTRTRWGYQYPYDVALWATISDFPYSWPLWQRYSSKFVSTNLISNVGFSDVDSTAVSNAVAGHTLFIHGTSVEGGSGRTSVAEKYARDAQPLCTDSCGGVVNGLTTVCDKTCAPDGRFGGFLCGAGDVSKFGSMCRACYTDRSQALEVERQLRKADGPANSHEAKHVIMCDTLSPPAAMTECDTTCTENNDAVCDDSCGTGRHGDYNCNWRGHGAKCRACFTDVRAALLADKVAERHGGHVIMCDTHEPPSSPDALEVVKEEKSQGIDSKVAPRRLQKWKENAKWKEQEKWKGGEADDDVPKWKATEKWKNVDTPQCEDGCDRVNSDGTKGRVCDESCADGVPYGTRDCDTKGGLYGELCRRCYYDLEQARAADSPGTDNRVIMCDTLAPPDAYDRRHLVSDAGSAADAISGRVKGMKHEPRRLQKWKENAKWKEQEKWKGGEADDDVPKWKATEKWKAASGPVCEDGCDRVNSDGTKGRVCDESCADGVPYGTRDCGTKGGLYGELCRRCYYDLEQARAADSPGTDSRVIMCDTLAPPDAYDRRHLSVEEARVPQHKSADSDAFVDVASVEEGSASVLRSYLDDASAIPFGEGFLRKDICVFIADQTGMPDATFVMVDSIMHFLPGATVAIAAPERDFDTYARFVGGLPKVRLFPVRDVSMAALSADHYCGADAQLIYYMDSASLMSRTPTIKDTHSLRGDLLVVYTDARRTDGTNARWARATTAVLGFSSPSFTFGTDLILPATINADLRNLLLDGKEIKGLKGLTSAEVVLSGYDDISVPQVLAAHAYSRSTPGIWFFDPQQWTASHLFSRESIWDVPLLKPRFTCSLDARQVGRLSHGDVVSSLEQNLEFLTRGGKCETGFMGITSQE